MTEHTKIPVPETEEKGSLIERAVKALDLGGLAPPPVPTDLAPPVIKPGQRHRRPAPPPVEIAADEIAAPVDVAEAVAVVPSAPQPIAFTSARLPVDRARLREHGMILPEGQVTALLEEFRIVKRQLLAQAADLRRQGMTDAAQRVLIASANPGDGKTYCAINLALAMAAEKDTEVVLVDADFAKPSILTALGLPGGPGLMDALADPAIDVAQCVLGTDIDGLWVLPAGNTTTSDSEYLSSARTVAVLDRLSRGAPNRVFIFDSPPVLAASPAAELAKYVGQTLVVVRSDRTGQSALEDAVSLLSACPNVQLLLNGVQYSPSGRRFGAYYGYGG